jgi:hypothetical protein
MALSFDLLTMLTVSGILAILTIYVIVVFKKGWLKRESKADQAYYLCPNQKCRRVFNKPVWLTDLSHTPPESYQACPHCGANVQAMSSNQLSAGTSEQVKPLIGASEVENPQAKLRSTTQEITSDRSDVNSRPKPGFQTGDPASHQKSEERPTAKPFFHFPKTKKDTQQKPQEPPKKSEAKGPVEYQRKCSHFFGYVKTLPKNTPIPDECLWCPSIVDCLSHEQKVEVET